MKNGRFTPEVILLLLTVGGDRVRRVYTLTKCETGIVGFDH